MSKKIGIGVIGTGFAQRTQIPAFKAIDAAEVVSVASGSLFNAKAASGEFNIPHFCDDWRETAGLDDVDLVCITTPPDLHFEMTVEALANRKHILCEKPMAMNCDEANEMTRLSHDSGQMALIDHELRFTNGRAKAFEMIRNGRIGKIRHAKYLFRNSSRGDESLPWTWWSDIEQGGGVLGAIGSHVIDTLRWFTGAEIAEVHCRLHTHVKHRPANGAQIPVTSDDETLMVLKLGDSEFVEDATAHVSCSMVEAGPYRNRIDFFGTDGAVRVEDGGEVYLADIRGGVWKPIEIDLGTVAPGMEVGGWSRGFTVLAGEIVSALQKGETTIEHAATFLDGLAVQRVLDAARLSNRSGEVVRI